MTATDELRRLLDERGVEHRDRYSHTKGRENPGTSFTTWFVNRDNARFTARADELDDGEFGLFFSVEAYRVTPEQAIAATLGDTDATWARRVDARTTTRHGKFRTKYGRSVPCCECCGYGIGDTRWHYCPSCGAEVVE